eukprot:858373-Prorocentrum_minimum.AAC.1
MYARMYVRMHVGSGVLSAPLPLSAQEDSENEVISLYVVNVTYLSRDAADDGGLTEALAVQELHVRDASHAVLSDLRCPLRVVDVQHHKVDVLAAQRPHVSRFPLPLCDWLSSQ